MKRFKLSKPVSVGDKWMRGKIIDIRPYDDRHWVISVRYRYCQKQFLVWID